MKIIVSLIFLIFTYTTLSAQECYESYFIKFKDKKFTKYSFEKPEEFLSLKALERRKKNNILIDSSDLPVCDEYINILQDKGFKIKYPLKWFNGVVVSEDKDTLLEQIKSLSFIENIIKIKPCKSQKTTNKKFEEKDKDEIINIYGLSVHHFSTVNATWMRDSGLTGNNITICILDAGFNSVDNLPAFTNVINENRIIASRNFVDNGNIYLSHNHGTMVFSIMAGYISNNLIGTATDAKYVLVKTEDSETEFIIEEYNWTAGAEFADSIGADIINSSLGYYTFDDSSQNHTYKDMNGTTTIVTQAANIAFSKGILVVASAGNEANDSWKYIIAPADGDKVLSVGAIDQNLKRAPFSSVGPSSDGDIKPNIVAMGYNNVVQTYNGGVQFSSGTSLAAPVISGLAASLWQAFPEMKNSDIFKAIEKSSSQYNSPDSLIGYGIPDFLKAYKILENYRNVQNFNRMYISLYPNPVRDKLNIEIYDNKENSILIEIYALQGNLLFSRKYNCNNDINNLITIEEFRNFQSGIYILSIKNSENQLTKFKIFKIN
jgi:subtilisin family serine protease